MNQIPASFLKQAKSMPSYEVSSLFSGSEISISDNSKEKSPIAQHPGINPYAILKPLPIGSPSMAIPVTQTSQSQDLAIPLDTYTKEITQLLKLVQDTMQKLMEGFIRSITRVLSSVSKLETMHNSANKLDSDSIQAAPSSSNSTISTNYPTQDNTGLTPTNITSTRDSAALPNTQVQITTATENTSTLIKDSMTKIEGFFDHLLSMKEDIKRVFKKGGKVIDLFKKVGGQALEALFSKTPIGKLTKGASSIFKKITKLF